MPILETERLILREKLISDAPFLFDLNADPLVIQYTGNAAFENLAEAEEIVRYVQAQYREYGYGRWLVVEKISGLPLGFCGLKYHPNSKKVDIGYRFMRAYWNKGYATEAALACLGYGFSVLKLEHIFGNVQKENLASVRVLEKIGMYLVRESNCGGEPSFIYQISKPQTA